MMRKSKGGMPWRDGKAPAFRIDKAVHKNRCRGALHDPRVQCFSGGENQEVNIRTRVAVVGVIHRAEERRSVETLLNIYYPLSYP